MSGINEFLGHLIEHLGSGENADGVVVKTMPIKKEWKQALDEKEKATEEALALIDKAETAKARAIRKASVFWAMVEESMNDYTTKMRYNPDIKEIEILKRTGSKEVGIPFRIR